MDIGSSVGGIDMAAGSRVAFGFAQADIAFYVYPPHFSRSVPRD
jgi:hypothetical protein